MTRIYKIGGQRIRIKDQYSLKIEDDSYLYFPKEIAKLYSDKEVRFFIPKVDDEDEGRYWYLQLTPYTRKKRVKTRNHFFEFIDEEKTKIPEEITDKIGVEDDEIYLFFLPSGVIRIWDRKEWRRCERRHIKLAA